MKSKREKIHRERVKVRASMKSPYHGYTPYGASPTDPPRWTHHQFDAKHMRSRVERTEVVRAISEELTQAANLVVAIIDGDISVDSLSSHRYDDLVKEMALRRLKKMGSVPCTTESLEDAIFFIDIGRI